MGYLPSPGWGLHILHHVEHGGTNGRDMSIPSVVCLEAMFVVLQPKVRIHVHRPRPDPSGPVPARALPLAWQRGLWQNWVRGSMRLSPEVGLTSCLLRLSHDPFIFQIPVSYTV